MKKLMVMAASVALVGGAFAATVANDGNIFDYKASVKYVDFKKITSGKTGVLVKVVKSATLTGYLVTPRCCPCQIVPEMEGGPCTRFGMEPSFLVIQNKASKKYNADYGLSDVKIMPANLLTEWWNAKSWANLKENQSATYEAQGYLFSGVGKRDVPDPHASPFYGLGDHGLFGAGDTCPDRHLKMTAATQFLFGYYNVADVSFDPDGNVVKADFIEPFLDHAGFGKARIVWGGGARGDAGAPCVIPGEDQPDTPEVCLTSLSGTLIGGAFDCAYNGSEAVKDGKYWAAGGAVYGFSEQYLCQGWDDYTENAKSWGSVNYQNQMEQPFDNAYMYNVVCGTWSIKVNTKIATDKDDTYIDDVRIVGAKIDRNFTLRTFDTPDMTSKKTRGYKISGLEDEFYWKWMADQDGL